MIQIISTLKSNGPLANTFISINTQTHKSCFNDGHVRIWRSYFVFKKKIHHTMQERDCTLKNYVIQRENFNSKYQGITSLQWAILLTIMPDSSCNIVDKSLVMACCLILALCSLFCACNPLVTLVNRNYKTTWQRKDEIKSYSS